MSNFDDVKIFMKTFGQEIKSKPDFPNDKITQLRYDLIKEELDEFEQFQMMLDESDVQEDETDSSNE